MWQGVAESILERVSPKRDKELEWVRMGESSFGANSMNIPGPVAHMFFISFLITQ